MLPMQILLITALGFTSIVAWNCSPCKCIITKNKEKLADCSLATINQKLSSIPSGVDTKVEILNFTGQSFTTLDGNIFENFLNLKQLIFSNNMITNINETVFYNLTQLEFVDMSYNHLRSLFLRNIWHLKTLNTMRLDNNPWVCDEKLCDIRFFVTSTNKIEKSHSPKCAFPPELKGRTWEELENYTLTIKAENSHITERDSVVLTCQYTGAKRFDIEWEPDSLQTTRTMWDNKYNRYYSSLIFESINKREERMYACKIPDLNSTVQKYLNVHKIHESHVHIVRIITLSVVMVGVFVLIGYNYQHAIIILLHKNCCVLIKSKHLLMKTETSNSEREDEESIEMY